MNSDVVVRCINDFCKDLDKKTVLVMDNSPIHTSETFQENIPLWKGKELEIFYLPKYSPELNIIEILHYRTLFPTSKLKYRKPQES